MPSSKIAPSPTAAATDGEADENERMRTQHEQEILELRLQLWGERAKHARTTEKMWKVVAAARRVLPFVAKYASIACWVDGIRSSSRP